MRKGAALWQVLAAAVLASLATWLGGQTPPWARPPAPPPAAPPPPPVAPEPEKPAPPKPAPPKPDPAKAIARIQFGRAGCSATVIGPRRDDGRYWVLTAGHCVNDVGQRGKMMMADGRVIPLLCKATNPVADCAWCETEVAGEELPFALVASKSPALGSKIWHAGYGFDKPGNREDGTIESGPGDNGQIRMKLSVSNGDSGGGIFLNDSGEVISCVCCTAGVARLSSVWGSSPESIRRLLPTPMVMDEWTPLPVPVRPEPDLGGADRGLAP